MKDQMVHCKGCEHCVFNEISVLPREDCAIGPGWECTHPSLRDNCKRILNKGIPEIAFSTYRPEWCPLKLEQEDERKTDPKEYHGLPLFQEMLREMAEVHSDKNHDYSGEEDPFQNLTACERINVRCPHCNKAHKLEAWIGVLIRLQDKLSRLESMAGLDSKVVDESIDDTLLDSANYNIIARILKRRGKVIINKGGTCRPCARRHWTKEEETPEKDVDSGDLRSPLDPTYGHDRDCECGECRTLRHSGVV